MEGRYAKYAKEIPIRGRVGTMALGAVLDRDFFGWDSVSIRYGLIDGEGVVPEETEKLHTHDYDQILWLVSGDPGDMLELGAEVEVTLGTEGIRRRFTNPTAILLPGGTPHFSPLVRRLDRPFYFLSVNCTGKLEAAVTDPEAVQGAGPWAEFMGPYARNVSPLHFARKGPYHYGSAVNTDSGGVYAHVNSASALGIPLTMTWQTVTLPHPLGPRKEDMDYHPHVHPDYDEALIFLSLDQENLTDLHGEADFCFGEEGEDQEHYSVTKAAAMLQPRGVYHLPLTFRRVDKPMIFISLSRR